MVNSGAPHQCSMLQNLFFQSWVVMHFFLCVVCMREWFLLFQDSVLSLHFVIMNYCFWKCAKRCQMLISFHFHVQANLLWFVMDSTQLCSFCFVMLYLSLCLISFFFHVWIIETRNKSSTVCFLCIWFNFWHFFSFSFFRNKNVREILDLQAELKKYEASDWDGLSLPLVEILCA